MEESMRAVEVIPAALVALIAATSADDGTTSAERKPSRHELIVPARPLYVDPKKPATPPRFCAPGPTLPAGQTMSADAVEHWCDLGSP
jgi:hypothetical protein